MAARSNNVGIMLARLRLTAKEIRQAIVEVDDDVLGVDDLEAIMRNLPTGDEVRRRCLVAKLD